MDWSSWFRRTLLKDPKGTQISDSPTKRPSKKKQQRLDDELEEFGVTKPLIDQIKTFTVDTFKNYPSRDGDGDSTVPDNGTATTSGNVRKDLSEWQERHATLVLSEVKEMSRLRFMLCPRHFKEQEFWRIYFMLVKSHVAEYELHAIRLAKLKTMAIGEKESMDSSSWEVEMSESKQVPRSEPSSPVQTMSS